MSQKLYFRRVLANVTFVNLQHSRTFSALSLKLGSGSLGNLILTRDVGVACLAFHFYLDQRHDMNEAGSTPIFT